MRNPVRPVALLLAGLLTLAGVVAPTPAFAHAALIESDPAQGAELEAAPREVTFSFNEDISQPAYVVVTAAGERVEQGSPRVEGGTVTQPVADGAGSGRWTMAYRVVSTDGHPVTGEISFSVADTRPTADPTPQPTAAATVDPGGDPGEDPGEGTVDGTQSGQAATVGETQEAGLWARHGEHFVVGGVLLALAAGVLLLVRRRSA
jgi:methionine-rich copper-binding protein CopC